MNVKALVLKTNQIVNIVRKDGEHYIDNNYNPYKKDELEFFIKQNNVTTSDAIDDEEQEEVNGVELNGQFVSFEELAKIQSINNALDKLMWLSSTVIQQHPDYTCGQVANFCFRLYMNYKEGLRNQKQ